MKTASAAAPTPARHSGKVIWYDQAKGYGFLAVEGFPDDLFVHNSEVRKAKMVADDLDKGVAIRCNIGAKDGRPCAVDLEEGE
jgi:cold shock CspA family protein